MSEQKTWDLLRATVVRTLDNGSSGQGAGLHHHLLVGRFGASGTRRNYRSYIKFTPDWTGVAKLVSATLTVYTDDFSEFGAYDSNDFAKVTFRKLTSAFTEGDSEGFETDDYTNPSYTTSLQITKSLSEAADGLTNIDVTAIVKTWAPATVAGGSGTLAEANARNHGFGLYGTTDVNENWGGWSDEHTTPGLRPQLTLVYELGPTTPNAPTDLSPSGAVDSVGAFEGDFTDTRATDYLVETNVQVFTASAVKSGDADTDDTIDVTAHGFTTGQVVWFLSLTGGTGLSLSRAYYVRQVVNANSFKVSETSGGPFVNITVAYSALTVASPKWAKAKVASNTERLNDRSFVLPDGLTLSRNTSYKWRMRQKDNDSLWSPWTTLTTFSVNNTDPNAPTAVRPDADGTPAAGDFSSLNGVQFRSTFSDPDPADDYLLAYQIQLSDLEEGDPGWDEATFLKWDTGKVYVASGQVAHWTNYGGSDLAAGTYYWRVRHWDSHDGLSAWSYARIVLTSDFDAAPGSQTSIQVDPHAPWRIRIREMKFNALDTGAITGNAGTNLLTSAKNHGLVVHRKVRFSALSGGTGLVVGRDYWVLTVPSPKTFTLAAEKGGSTVDFTTNVTSATLTGVTTRGPGNVVAVLEDAKSVGGSIVYNSPGDAHFTLPVDHAQISVIEPRQTHYGVDFYTGDGWRETYAGLVWDVDANERDAVFPCVDYLGLLDAVNDERYYPAEPDRPYTKGGSKYVDQTITTVVTDQLNRARAIANSPVGFIELGTIATMDEKVTIWSTMEPVLSFISGLLDSHRQGTGKKTRISVRRKTNGNYEFVVEDNPGQTRDNLRLRYGELVNGYRVVVFGDAWASVTHGIGRTREGIRVLYKTASAPGIDQKVWGRYSRALVLNNVSDEADATRRTKQLAIKAGKLGQGMGIGVRTGLLRPLDGYDVCDDFPVAIRHGAVNTDNYGSGYWTLWAVAWEAMDDGTFDVALTLSPREDTVAPDDDLIDSVPISTQPEWQMGWQPPGNLNPRPGTRRYLDQNTGKTYTLDPLASSAVTGITGDSTTFLFSKVGHGFLEDDAIYFGNVVPTDCGLVEGATYYVIADGLTADAFKVSETEGGAVFELTYDMSDGAASHASVYTEDTDPATSGAPLTGPTAPTTPPVTSDVAPIWNGGTPGLNGTVQMKVGRGSVSPEARLRSVETQITRVLNEFSDPDWTAATVVHSAPEVEEVTIPTLGDADYRVRQRFQDVFGQVSDWSDEVAHTTAAGADSAGVVNSPATVIIDADGITIEDGALTLRDEFGETVMFASGFDGSWFDFIRLGIYNARFLGGLASGDIALGRTTDLPYWTASRVTGLPTAAKIADGGLEIRFAATGNQYRIVSDFVPVMEKTPYVLPIVLSAVHGSGTMTVETVVSFYDGAGSGLAGLTVDSIDFTVGSSAEIYKDGGITSPADARFAKVQVTVTESGTHSGSNRINIHSIGLIPATLDSTHGVDYTIGVLNVLVNIDFDGWASLDAPSSGVLHTPDELQVGDPTGSNTSGVSINAGGSLEIVKEASTPFIDFKNDSADDFDARIVLTGDDVLSVQGAALDVRRIQHQAASIISPTALAANTNDWNPTGLGTAYLIRATSDATPRNLTGIVAQADGTILYLHNANAATTITLVHDATSTGANRFLCPGAANYALTAKRTVMLVYDSTADRWLVLG